MRIFDAIGALVVASWLGLVGLYTYQLHVDSPVRESAPSTTVAIEEGDSWMILSREEREVGYLHETRTRIEEGWLLEYELLISVSMLGAEQLLQTGIKATTDADGLLREVTASVETAAGSFEVEGRVDGEALVLEADLGGGTTTRRLPLHQPPRLSNSALNGLVARADLQPGASFEESYFDPTTMGMTTMRFEYVGPHEIDVYGEAVATKHFRQRIAGAELDVYVDDTGEVWIQEFPLRIVGAKVPGELGRGRALALRRRLEKGGSPAAASDLSAATALSMLRGEGSPTEVSRWAVEGIPEALALELDSGAQAVASRQGASAVVDTAASASVPGPDAAARQAMLATTPRVDADAAAVARLVGDDPGDESTAMRAREAARRVRRAMKEVGTVALTSASAALERGQGDCTEHALVLVAALRHMQIPARFVFGVRLDEEGRPIPHQWVQFVDGDAFVDLDATSADLEPSTSQLQLLTGAQPEHPAFVHALDALTLEPLPPADVDEIDADFD